MSFSSAELKGNLFFQIFESGMMGLAFTSKSGKIVEANKSFLDLIGYSAEDLKNNLLDWNKITPQEFHKINKELISQCEKNGFSQILEKEYFKKDGSRVQVLIGTTKVANAKSFEFMIYAVDISESKKIKNDLAKAKAQLETHVDNRTKELSETNMFLQSLIENIPNMIFVKDAKNLKFVRFNKAGEDLLGIKRDALLGKSDYDFFPKEEAEFFIKKDRKVLEKKLILDIPEETITTAYGQKVLHTKKIPLLDENGNPNYLLGISEDITEIKKLETERYNLIREQAGREEAEKNIARLELLSDANIVLTASLDYESTLKNFYNFMISRFADWCQLTVFKTDNKDATQFVFETTHLNLQIASSLMDYRWKLIKDVDEALKSQPDKKELLLELKKLNFKSVIHVGLKARGNNIGHILLGTMANSNRAYSLADLQLAEELADRASFAIDNARLFSEAQIANQLKDEFLATLSHELRTPLNIISGYAELLLNFSTDMSEKEKADSLDAIYRNAIDQANIVNDILDVSKIITGKMNINFKLLSPADIIHAVIKNITHMAEAKNVDIILEIPKIPPSVMMDGTRMQQIIWNLVSNAVKFTPSGGRVTVKNYIQDEFCVIEVADTGVGINLEFLPHIFERFRQEDGSTTRKYGGLGLGLSIVKHLVEMHAGTIEAKSEGKNLGSQFIVKVPLAKATDKANIPEILKYPDNYLENVKILLIDDSRDNRLLITKLLAGYSADIQEAASAPLGRALLNTFKPHIILCDIGMPGEDGMEFLNNLRKSKNKIPIIALTAYARPEEKEAFLKAGFNAHVAKPVSIQTLLSEIKKLI